MLADDLCSLICRLPGDLWDKVPWDLKIATGALVGDEKVMGPGGDEPLGKVRWVPKRGDDVSSL